jgi:hypothetical protein
MIYKQIFKEFLPTPDRRGDPSSIQNAIAA